MGDPSTESDDYVPFSLVAAKHEFLCGDTLTAKGSASISAKQPDGGTLANASFPNSDNRLSRFDSYSERFIGIGTTLQYAWPSRGLHCHASAQTSRDIALQRNNQTHTMLVASTRGTDILIRQFEIESELTKQQTIRTLRWS